MRIEARPVSLLRLCFPTHPVFSIKIHLATHRKCLAATIQLMVHLAKNERRPNPRSFFNTDSMARSATIESECTSKPGFKLINLSEQRSSP